VNTTQFDHSSVATLTDLDILREEARAAQDKIDAYQRAGNDCSFYRERRDVIYRRITALKDAAIDQTPPPKLNDKQRAYLEAIAATGTNSYYRNAGLPQIKVNGNVQNWCKRERLIAIAWDDRGIITLTARGRAAIAV